MGKQVNLNHIFSIISLSVISNRFLDAPIKTVTGTSWRKSSFSTYNGNCVEVGRLDSERIGVRDTTQHGRGPVLAFTQDEWSAFLSGAKIGKFDSV